MFPFCFDLLVVLVCITWVGDNSVLTGNQYPFFTVADRISYTYFKSRCYSHSSFGQYNSGWQRPVVVNKCEVVSHCAAKNKQLVTGSHEV